MPEHTEQLLLFPNTGLQLTGPKRTVARSALRRALGVHETNVGSLRLRPGDEALYNLGGIHSLGRLNTDRFQCIGGSVYRNGVLLFSGNNGSTLTFQKAQPSEGLPDYLFISGGGLSRKILSDGTVQLWGIAPPGQSLIVSENANNSKTIELFEDHTTWTYTNVSAHADEATIIQEGTNSLKVSIASNTIAVFQKAFTLNLSTYGASASPDQDHIELWVRVANSPAFDYMVIRFDVGAGNFATDYYQYKVFPTQLTPNSDIFGIGVSPLVDGQEGSFITGDGEGAGVDADAASSPGPTGNDGIGADSDGSSAVAAPNTWTHLRIPKSSFFRSGGGAGTWANVAGLQFTIKTNSYAAIDLYLDDCLLIGGAGMEGRYRYHTTFRNTVTGNRSNPEPNFVEISNIDRTSIAGSGLAVSADTQVNQREIWRTVGNGTVFFRGTTIDNNSSTTFTDSVADYSGLDGLASQFLEPTQLQFDNAQPDNTYNDFLIDSLTSFWISNDEGKRGRLYYSPLGRPEGVKGFITITSDNDALQRIVNYNGIKFIFSLNGVFRIDGTDPYTKRRVTGVPGVLPANKRTVVSSPVGIWYQASDGIRLFDGNISQLVFYERLGDIFRGKTVDYFPPFEGDRASFQRGQYYISNGSRTLVINPQTQFIRELGIGLSALFFEDDTKLLLGALPTTLSIIESENADPFQFFDIETGSLQLQVGQDEVVKRIRIKGKFYNHSIQPTIILDDNEIPLPPFTIDKGSIEYPFGRKGQSISVRLQNITSITQTLEVEAIELDIYTPFTSQAQSQFAANIAQTLNSTGSSV